MSKGKQIVISRNYKAKLEDVWALWTTKAGFESWWGPVGFRAQVSALDAHEGGTLKYAMIASTPEMIAAMKAQGQPASHAVTSTFRDVRPMQHLVLANVIDFIPGVEPYVNNITVDFSASGGTVTMVTTLESMHSEEMTGNQEAGYTSQLSKMDAIFA
jgi:uncharacterized protein YndB with AHSA1/START domain